MRKSQASNHNETEFNLTQLFCSIFYSVSDKGFVYPVEMVNIQDRPRLIYHGFAYAKHYMNKNTTYWRCVYSSNGCRARILTCSINGQNMTNKKNEAINHTEHYENNQVNNQSQIKRNK